MGKIHLTTHIQASIERCFDLARDVDLHKGSMAHTNERAVAGVTSGLMELGDTVTWEARHLGVTRHLTTRITEFAPPHRFVDEQVHGPFAYMRHVHEFQSEHDGTVMVDDFEYGVPFGLLGKLVDALVLKRYMRTLLQTRNRYLKQVAESDLSESQVR